MMRSSSTDPRPARLETGFRIAALPSSGSSWRYAAVAGATAVVLVLTVEVQMFDTTFYALWEATALLAGDHPYRDFYEWGVPLQALVSAAAQVLVGHRAIGEMLVHWLCITVGVVVSFDLGLRASRSLGASVVMLLLTLLVLVLTPTYHYPKLLFYPIGLALAWRYLEQPTAAKGAALGFLTAAAFLYRHDHGIHLGVAAVLAFVLARVAVPASRRWRGIAAEAAAYAAAATLILLPWLILVQQGEGITRYVRARAELYQIWSPNGSPFRALASMNPLHVLIGEPLPAPKRSVVAFDWDDSTDAARQAELVREFGLRPVEDGDGRLHAYEVANLYDPALLRLKKYLAGDQGFDWERLQAHQFGRLSPRAAYDWLQQIGMLVPLLLAATAAVRIARRGWRGSAPSLDALRLILAGTFLAIVDWRLLREPSYVTAVAPLTAALAAVFLRVNNDADGEDPPRSRPVMIWARTRWALAAALVVVTGVAVVEIVTQRIPDPRSFLGRVAPTFARLFVSPPIDAHVPLDQMLQYDRASWLAGALDRDGVVRRYINHCTRSGDRVLVTGATPFELGYVLDRPPAGGHVFWHHGWRADSAGQTESLALLQRQSVPFAIATSEPVLDDLKAYSRIHEYFLANYDILEGTGGYVLVDRRRQATGQFGLLGFPCFRE